MKTILLLSILSSGAMACPSLQGNYQSCTKTTNLAQLPGLKISQSLTRGVTTYEFIREDDYTGVDHREVIVADGEFYQTDEGSDSDIQYKVAYHCTNNQLNYEYMVEQNQDGETVRIGIKGSVSKVGERVFLEKNGTVVLDEKGRISVKSDPEITICE